MRLISKALLSFALCGMMLAVGAGAAAQDKSQTPAPPSSCSRDNALEIIEQQIGATRTFDNAVQRITVLVHAADLLWAFQQKKARAAFTEAFDLAVQNFKDKGYELMRGGKTMMISLPDQRYTVIGAIAKHDATWAKKLTDQMLKDEQQAAEDKPTRDIQRDTRIAEELLSMAISLLPSDEPAALNFARRSLRYPATLYLSSYPFGNDRDAGEMPGYTIYQVPAGFVPNSKLQRMFVQTILRRVREFGNNPSEPAPDDRLSEPEQMWLALTRLETQIQQSLPDLAA